MQFINKIYAFVSIQYIQLIDIYNFITDTMNKPITIPLNSDNQIDNKYQQSQTNILQLNSKAMNLLQLGQIQKSLKNLNLANKLLESISTTSKIYKKLKAITLNTWACYLHQKKKNNQALKIIDQGILLEQNNDSDNLALSRAYLNKCVILSELNNHSQALNFANKAIQLLNKQKMASFNKNRLNQNQKLTELFAISFYNVAAEFQYLKNNQSAIDAYKKGFELSRQILGEKHKLSIMMKKNLKLLRDRNREKQMQINQILNSSKHQKFITQPASFQYSSPYKQQFRNKYDQSVQSRISQKSYKLSKLNKYNETFNQQNLLISEKLQIIKNQKSKYSNKKLNPGIFAEEKSLNINSNQEKPKKNKSQKIQNQFDIDKIKNIYLPSRLLKFKQKDIKTIRKSEKKVFRLDSSLYDSIQPKKYTITSKHSKQIKFLNIHRKQTIQPISNSIKQKQEETIVNKLPDIKINKHNSNVKIQMVPKQQIKIQELNNRQTKKQDCTLI